MAAHKGGIRSLNSKVEALRKETNEEAIKKRKSTEDVCKMIQGDIEKSAKKLMNAFKKACIEVQDQRPKYKTTRTS